MCMWACEEPWLALPWKVPKSWPAALPVPAWMLENMDEAYMEDYNVATRATRRYRSPY